MVFSSLLFLIRFLPVILLIYYVAPRKYRNFILFVGSIIFYAWGEPVYVLLILFSTVIDYTAGRVIGRCRERGNVLGTKLVVLCSVVVNVGALGVFKYADFFITLINHIPFVSIEPLNLALPIGISFYTFQTMSYTIDVYRKEADVQKNFISFGAYVALFPQLIAGPILRYKTVAKQLDFRKESIDLFKQGVLRFTVGLGKKVLIANQLGALWNEIATTEIASLAFSQAWLGAIAFSLQIYFDFSGYSDMAIGLGKMFGFEFLENFDYPYESKSITEFWRRWHISLGTWFKEYVYYPLGGNRKGTKRQMLNIGIVWALTGLWHGAEWCFVLWGIYYGVLLVIEKLCLRKILQKIPQVFSRIYTMFIVVVGWSIFSWPDMADGAGYLKTMFGFGQAGWNNHQTMYALLNYRTILFVAVVGCTSWLKKLANRYLPENTYRREVFGMLFITLIFGTSMACLVNSSYNPFLYFRF
ncbi:MAG: MBOAT family O-acyltransferase [Butyribacter sp.]|nr:MBOAT family protein [bacterium]MDY3854809.1 MBOAT family O-acyltransferase [Butyribacter sp.]